MSNNNSANNAEENRMIASTSPAPYLSNLSSLVERLEMKD
jgi:hypothetical protein